MTAPARSSTACRTPAPELNDPGRGPRAGLRPDHHGTLLSAERFCAEVETMTSFRIAALAAFALAIGGCSTLRDEPRPRGSELVDHQVRMETANGVVSTLDFNEDGSV